MIIVKVMFFYLLNDEKNNKNNYKKKWEFIFLTNNLTNFSLIFLIFDINFDGKF